MLIPYSTDAPIYHMPIATVTLIVVNVLCFFTFCIPSEDDPPLSFVAPDGQQYSFTEVMEEAQRRQLQGQDAKEYVDSMVRVGGSRWQTLKLEFGRGYRPWQWFTAMFMHADLGHLIGNMIFLWSFGLILEGKLGNFLFPALYLAMGAFQAFLVQTLMLFSNGSALGASGAIFSLLALVVIFAPVNSFDVVLWIFLRPFTFEMPILSFGALYVAMNVAFFLFGGATMSSEALHLVGFAVGLPVGFFMLTQGYVDCEGYDLISHWQDNKGKKSKVGKKKRREREKRSEQTETETPTPEAVRSLIGSQIDAALQGRKFDVAVALHRKLAEQVPGTRWQSPQLTALIRGYWEAGDFGKAERFIGEHIDNFETNRFNMQCNLIKLWLQQQRPRHALRYIQGFNLALLTPDEKEKLGKLAATAKKQIKAGVVELQ